MNMKSTIMPVALALLALLNLAAPVSAGFAQGTAFTYQGRLNASGALASGSYDLELSLYDTNSPGGNLISGPITNLATMVSNGLFVTTVDFGPGVFTGSNRWLQIAVSTNGANSFSTLSPRQLITPAPYAITAGNLSAVVANNTFPSGIFATINGGGGNLIVSPADHATISGGGGNTIAGGGGTVAGGNNNAVSNFNATISGGANNVASGNAAAIGGGSENRAVGDHSVISGGQGNLATGDHANIAGGSGNAVSGQESVIGGGLNNTNNGGYYSVIGGGWLNQIPYGSATATIGGGQQNQGYGVYWTIGGGYNNYCTNTATVAGGDDNRCTGNSSTIGGGEANSSSADYATVGGGAYNAASGPGSFVGGGGADGTNIEPNNASGAGSFIGGGLANAASGYYAAVAGGSGNIASGSISTIAGGDYNVASGAGSVVGGGGYDGVNTNGNIASGVGAVVGGGLGNTAIGRYSTIGGGSANIASGSTATVSGGFANVATNFGATVPGGYGNTASGSTSFAAGAQAQAVHTGAFVWADSSGGFYSSDRMNQFKIRAAGGVQMDISGSAGLSPAAVTINSTSGNGIGLLINQNSSDTTALFANGGTGDIIKGFSGNGNTVFEVNNDGTVKSKGFTLTSDRNAKENFAPLDGLTVLAKVIALPVTEWNYKDDAAGKKHIGPMAQDFYAAFGLNGADDKHIAVVDEGGVALAAIQGLNRKLQEQQAELQQKETEVTDLKLRLAALEEFIYQQKSR
jgi:hypothetical protein